MKTPRSVAVGGFMLLLASARSYAQQVPAGSSSYTFDGTPRSCSRKCSDESLEAAKAARYHRAARIE